MAACLKLYNMEGTGLRFGRTGSQIQRVATLPGFAAAQVSIEQIDGAVYSEGMSDQDIARFRAQTEECHQQAELAIGRLDKESWLRVAGEWIKLAQEAEQRRDRR